jgi:hypothetical protein
MSECPVEHACIGLPGGRQLHYYSTRQYSTTVLSVPHIPIEAKVTVASIVLLISRPLCDAVHGSTLTDSFGPVRPVIITYDKNIFLRL